jgi:hypothetical protein
MCAMHVYVRLARDSILDYVLSVVFVNNWINIFQ